MGVMKRVKPDSTPSQSERDTGQRILFTGPDGIGDYRPRLDYSPHSIGIGSLSPDATSDLGYLFRAAPHAPPPVPRNRYTGEVGWGLQFSTVLNKDMMLTQTRDKQPSGERNHSTHDPYSENHNK